MLALTELMLGTKTTVGVASSGSVTPHGHIWASGPIEDITTSEAAVILTSKHPGDDDAALPKVPPGVVVRGFAHMKAALQSLYTDEDEDKAD